MKEVFYILILISLFSCDNEKVKNSTKPALSQIRESVYASVEVKPTISYIIQTNRTGIIQNILVNKGDNVKKGQVLFNVVNSTIDGRLTDAKLNLQQAKDNYQGNNNLLQNIKLELQAEQQQLSLDSLNFYRQKRLWEQNIGAKLDLDKAKLKYEGTSLRFKSLKEKYLQNTKNLENSYQKALNQYTTEQSNLKEFNITSEIDGMVYDIYKEIGEAINPQDKFGEIGSNENFKIIMNIDEVDITRLNIGDTAVIALDAYPDHVFTSKINYIFAKKDENTQTFTVEGTFLQLPPKVYNGLSGEANIIIDKRENVLTIPTNYLKEGNYVETSSGDVKITIGLKNLDFVEVISGIDTSTIILIPNK
jgi:multidrug efflux pump subunit AcrA (membrane-fusion protein)